LRISILNLMDEENRRSFHAGRNLLQQLQPFPADTVFKQHEAGGVAARLHQARDVAGANRVRDRHEHDW